jgi:hypothetical protein
MKIPPYFSEHNSIKFNNCCQVSPITVDKYLRGELETVAGELEPADLDTDVDQLEEVYDEETGEVVLVKVERVRGS